MERAINGIFHGGERQLAINTGPPKVTAVAAHLTFVMTDRM